MYGLWSAMSQTYAEALEQHERTIEDMFGPDSGSEGSEWHNDSEGPGPPSYYSQSD